MRIPPPSQGIGAQVIGDDLGPGSTEVRDCARPQPALSLTAQQIRKGQETTRANGTSMIKISRAIKGT